MIKENIQKILAEVPGGVEVVAVCKGRTPDEIIEAVKAGIKIIGENYVQETERVYPLIGNQVKWHFIGTLQKNKIRKIVKIFDMIETLDSLVAAEFLNRICEKMDRYMPVLVEINSGREENKSGILPEDAQDFIENISRLKNIKVLGLMTMGPLCKDVEEIRKYFRDTRLLFDAIKRIGIEGIEMRYLSMGMSDSYKIAIEEGANIIRIGRGIFGPLSDK